MLKQFSAIMLALLSVNTQAAPIFVVTPLVNTPSTATSGMTLTAIYQIINNTVYNFPTTTLVNLPKGISVVNTTNPGYCNTSTFSLNAGASCLMKVSIDTNSFGGSVTWNPKICSEGKKQFYCAEAYPSDQVQTTIMPAPAQISCANQVDNITFELINKWINNTYLSGWGYEPILIPYNNMTVTCSTDANGIAWMQQRAVDTAKFWVAQKINYCHHYSADVVTPLSERCDSSIDGPVGAHGGCCSFHNNLDEQSPTYKQLIRWNFSGRDSETAQYWQNFNRQWYGVDCTSFTRLVYNMGLGMLMTGDTPAQAGQTPNVPANVIAPNQQTAGNQLNYVCAPGALVCGDGTIDAGGNTFCAGHGGQFSANGVGNYFSLVNTAGQSQSDNAAIVQIVKSQLSLLQKGDIVYIAGALDTGRPSNNVTHGVVWTAQKVGYGPNDINPSLIAPDDLCTPQVNCNWRGVDNIGQWVVIDSHYQGPDYRVFTDFFYLYDTWGVRRIAGSSWAVGHNCNPPD